MTYLLNHWQVDSQENTLKNTDTNELFKVEPRSMAVLILLIESYDKVVSRDEFLSSLWEGRATVDESLTRCISELRKVLEEDSKKPRYIKTIHKMGYKLLVEAKKQEPVTLHHDVTLLKRKPFGLLFGALLLIVGLLLFILSGEKQTPNSPLIYNDLSDLRELLLQPNTNQSLFIWNNEANGAEYFIKTSQIPHPETGKIRALLQLIDGYKSVIWESSTDMSDPQIRTATVDGLLEILRLLALHKDAPELALLPVALRSEYKRALYLIDTRGRNNLEMAITLLDDILEKKPDFVMALVQKAISARTLSFYRETVEQRQQQQIEYDLLIKQALVTAPDHPVVKSLTSYVDLKQNNWYEMESGLKEAVEYSPACTICVRHLAELYLNLGFYERAAAVVEQHVDYFPLSIMMHSFLGQIYNMQARTAGAQHQIKVINALGRTDGSDALALEINVAMSEGNIETYRKLADVMVEKYPAYQQNKMAIEAVLRGDRERYKKMIDEMQHLDFNQAVTAGKFEYLIQRIKRNIENGRLRDLSLIHGWLNPSTHLTPEYNIGLLALKNRPEIVELFNDIGLIDFWREHNQWPDYCHMDQFLAHRPKYCPITL